MKRFVLRRLPGVVLVPALAQAYAGTSTSSGAVALFLLLLLPFVLPPVLVGWAYLRPHHRPPQLAQGAALLHTWLWCSS